MKPSGSSIAREGEGDGAIQDEIWEAARKSYKEMQHRIKTLMYGACTAEPEKQHRHAAGSSIRISLLS